MYKHLLISAAVYAASFFCPSLLWWGSFVFLVPLYSFFAPTHNQLKRAPVITTALLWSVIAYLPHTLTLLFVLIDMHSCWYGYSLVAAFILLFIVPTAAWFLLLTYAARTAFYTFVFWVTACAYTWFLAHAVGLVVGWSAGYPLIVPLLPLAVAWPQMSTTLWLGGRWVVIALLYGLQTTYAAGAYTFCRLLTLLFMLLTVMWVVVYFCTTQPTLPVTVICPVKPVYQKANLAVQLHNNQKALMQAAQQYPDAGAYLLPESAVFCEYQTVPELVHLLTDQVVIDNSTVIFGTYTHTQEQGDTKYNCLALAHKSRITVGYVKKQLVPIFETSNMLEKSSFSCGSTTQKLFYIPKVGYCFPLICSELLTPFAFNQPFPLLMAVHDGHFRFRYFKNLIYAYARLQAGVRRKAFIYSCYQ